MAEVNKSNLRLLTRLIESGRITTEKEILSLKLKDILSVPNLSKAELSAVCELQEAVKDGHILSFLTLPEKQQREGTEK